MEFQEKPSDQLPDLNEKSDAFDIAPLSKKSAQDIVTLIRRTLDPFEEAGSVLAASYRRLNNFYDTYSRTGSTYIVAIDPVKKCIIGGIGLGPLADLPLSEGLGEIREFVVETQYRNRGLGGALLSACLENAASMGYKRLYLETTKTMDPAQRLFIRHGFHPIVDHNKEDGDISIPSYYTKDL